MIKATQTEPSVLWKRRYHATALRNAKVAERARNRGLVTSSTTGAGQLYAWDVTTGSLRQLTHQQGGIRTGYLSPNGRAVYYLRDTGGSETGHFVRIPWEGGDEQDLTPDLPPYAALYRSAESANGAMFAFTPTEADGFPLYCLDLAIDGTVGAPRELHRSPKFVDDAAFSHDAELVVVATTEYAQARQYSLLVFDTASRRRVAELSDLPQGSLRAVTFSPVAGDLRLLCLADRSGTTRPLFWNPITGERNDILLADLPGDVEVLDWSPDGKRLLLCERYRATQRLHIYDLEAETLGCLRHPSGAYSCTQFGADNQIIALWTDSTHPPQVIALDGATGRRQGMLLALGKTLPARPFTSVTFPSSDGAMIQAWLGVPEGTGPFPTILSVHGGPIDAELDGYDPERQAWLDHGYAYITVNYRGSTSFGRDFKEQIWGDLGNLEVEDMVAARDWLINKGIARPDAILVTGASYGGYLTLMALGKRPDLWAGGMALIAPADWTSEYYEGTDWTKGYVTAMMGGTPDTKPEQYAASSPITYAERVTAPLLVIQGRNDLRCPPRQMERYVEKMRALGKPFQIEWFDAGHGGASTDLWLCFQQRLLEFAHQIVGEK